MNWDNFNLVATRILELAYINVLWILFTLVGLGVFGIFPSTTAMFGVVRKLIRKEGHVKIFSTFWTLFRQDFIKANGFGFILLAFAYFLYIDFTFIYLNDGQFGFLLPVIAFVFISCLATVLFLFPVYVHFNLKFFHYIKQSFLIAITSPIEVLSIALLAVAIYFSITLFPGAIPLFSGSVFAYFATIISLRAFKRIEAKQAR